MKKILAILLIPVFILTATVGITLTSYTCKGKDAIAMDKTCCKDGNMEGCCQKQSVHLKIKDAFIKVVSATNFSNSFCLIEEKPFVFSFGVFSKEELTAKGYWDKAPPSKRPELYILYHSIII